MEITKDASKMEGAGARRRCSIPFAAFPPAPRASERFTTSPLYLKLGEKVLSGPDACAILATTA